MAVEIITVQELADHLGIDIIDTQVANNLTRAINSADSWLRSGVDPQYSSEDPKCKELMLITAADLYDNRSLTSSEASTVRKLAGDYTLQLKAEALRRAEEEHD